MPKAIKNLFSSGSGAEPILRRFRPAGFSAPGAVGTFAGNQFRVSPTAARTEAIEGVSGAFQERAGAFRNLRGQVTPGFGRLSAIRQEGLRTRLNRVRQTGRRVVGNVRDELARRRLGGTSFQASAVGATEAEFAQLADEVQVQAQEQEAQAFLAELDLNRALISEEFDSSVSAFTTILNQLNLDTALAAGLSQVASQLMASNIAAQAEARAAHEAGQAEFLTTIVGAFLPT